VLLGLASEGATTNARAFIFLKIVMGWKNDASSTQPRFQPLWWLEKWGPLFFYSKTNIQSIFYSKHLEKTLKTLLS
jgi:hypothetical protein